MRWRNWLVGCRTSPARPIVWVWPFREWFITDLKISAQRPLSSEAVGGSSFYYVRRTSRMLERHPSRMTYCSCLCGNFPPIAVSQSIAGDRFANSFFWFYRAILTFLPEPIRCHSYRYTYTQFLSSAWASIVTRTIWIPSQYPSHSLLAAISRFG